MIPSVLKPKPLAPGSPQGHSGAMKHSTHSGAGQGGLWGPSGGWQTTEGSGGAMGWSSSYADAGEEGPHIAGAGSLLRRSDDPRMPNCEPKEFKLDVGREEVFSMRDGLSLSGTSPKWTSSPATAQVRRSKCLQG